MKRTFTLTESIYFSYTIQPLFVVKIQHWQKVQNFTFTHNFLAFSNTTIDSKLILKYQKLCALLTRGILRQ